MSKKIELFGRETCPPCKAIKKLLEEKNIEFDYIDVFEDQCYAVACGVGSVPHLIVDKVPYVNPSMALVRDILMRGEN